MARAAWMTLILAIALGWMPAAGIAEEQSDTAQGASQTEPAASTTDTAPAPETSTTDVAPETAPAPDAEAAVTAPETTPDQPQAPAADANAAPIPALKPIIITFSGDLSSIDANASPASMTVQDRYGVRKEISVPAEAKVSQGTDTKAVADLKVGDKLTVEYTYDVATGKRTAQSIIIGEAAAPKPAAQ